MYTSLLLDARVFEFLFQCDRGLAEQARGERCGLCHGKLHVANYCRKPRGGPEDVSSDFGLRFSFCCSEDGCRSRWSPPSLRFLGRRVYLAAVVLLVAAMLQGATRRRAERLRELIGVSPRTLTRWRIWWRTLFSKSPFWKAARGQFGLVLKTADLPQALLEQFRGDLAARLLSCLRFLAPITTTRAAAGFSMAAANPQKMRAVRGRRPE